MVRARHRGSPHPATAGPAHPGGMAARPHRKTQAAATAGRAPPASQYPAGRASQCRASQCRAAGGQRIRMRAGAAIRRPRRVRPAGDGGPVPTVISPAARETFMPIAARGRAGVVRRRLRSSRDQTRRRIVAADAAVSHPGATPPDGTCRAAWWKGGWSERRPPRPRRSGRNVGGGRLRPGRRGRRAMPSRPAGRRRGAVRLGAMVRFRLVAGFRGAPRFRPVARCPPAVRFRGAGRFRPAIRAGTAT